MEATLKNMEDLSFTKLSLFFIVRKYGFVAGHEAARYLRKRKIYCNENAISSRLWEMEDDGYFESRIRQGKKYKEWFIRR